MVHPSQLAEKHGKSAVIRDVARGGQCPECGRCGEDGGLYLIHDPERTLKVTPADKRWWTDTFEWATLGNMQPADVLTFYCQTPQCFSSKRLSHDELMAIKRKYGQYQRMYELNFKLRCLKCGRKNGTLRGYSNLPETSTIFVPLPGQRPDGFPDGWDSFEWRVLQPREKLSPEPTWEERLGETIVDEETAVSAASAFKK